MPLYKVPLFQNPRGNVQVEQGATKGATVGTNVWNADGTLFVPAAASTPTDPVVSKTLWELVLKVPPNVRALENATGATGLFAVTAASTGALRTIQPTVGRTTVSNGDGVAGDPVIDLAVVPDSGVGAALVVRFTRDGYGRTTGTQAATTDHLTEGATNLYHTAARVRDTLLTGLSTATNAVIAATDSVLSALGKLQAQVSAAMPGALVVSGTNVDYTYVSADANVARGKTTSTARLYTLDASVLRVGAFYYAANYASSGDVTVQPAVGTTLRQAGASVASVTVGPFVLTRFWIRSATEIWTM